MLLFVQQRKRGGKRRDNKTREERHFSFRRSGRTSLFVRSAGQRKGIKIHILIKHLTHMPRLEQQLEDSRPARSKSVGPSMFLIVTDERWRLRRFVWEANLRSFTIRLLSSCEDNREARPREPTDVFRITPLFMLSLSLSLAQALQFNKCLARLLRKGPRPKPNRARSPQQYPLFRILFRILSSSS